MPRANLVVMRTYTKLTKLVDWRLLSEPRRFSAVRAFYPRRNFRLRWRP